MQQGEGKEQERKTGQRGKVYIRDTETVKEKMKSEFHCYLALNKSCVQSGTLAYM